jgi:hypothetical protein
LSIRGSSQPLTLQTDSTLDMRWRRGRDEGEARLT